jgi:hypothetical protein
MVNAMQAARKIVNEVRFIWWSSLDFSSQRDWVYPRAYGLMRALGKSLVPANPALTFARDVPVSRIGTSGHKYKRFQ